MKASRAQILKLKHKRSRRKGVQSLLVNELKKLTHLLDLGYELKVRWVPGGSSDREGEVVKDTIIVYSEEPEKAIDTLWHEVLDYLLCSAIKPYEKLVNRQRIIINSLLAEAQEEAYQKKEEVVEKLKHLLEAYGKNGIHSELRSRSARSKKRLKSSADIMLVDALGGGG